MVTTMTARSVSAENPTDLDYLDVITDVAHQLGLGCWSNTIQGREHEAISLTRALRRDLMRLLEIEPSPSTVPTTVVFTDREMEVLRWAAMGKSANVTAQILNVSEKTVRKAWETVGGKLNCHNITQCVVAATRLGLL